jgi:replicative DNA helicase
VIADPRIEHAVAGAIAASPAALEIATLDGALTPHQFTDPVAAATFDACARLHDQGTYNPRLVAAQLEKDPRVDGQRHELLVERLVANPITVGELLPHINRLHDLTRRRRWQHAATAYQDAATTGDESRVAEAERVLANPEQGEDTMTVEQLARDTVTYLSGTGPPGIPTGIPSLDRMIGGGLRPGDVTAIASWTGHGKSIWTHGVLTNAARKGRRVHLYVNEMSGTDLTLRLLALDGAAPYEDLTLRQVQQRDMQRVLKALQDLPFAATDVSGWDGHRIARHIRTSRWDLCALDILHNVQHDGTRELDAIIRSLLAAARSSGTHLILCCHLNEERAKSELLPFPVARDIRQSGMVKNVCSNVLLLHRQQHRADDDTIVTSDDAGLHIDKARHGRLGGVALRFDPLRMRFLAVAAHPPR